MSVQSKDQIVSRFWRNLPQNTELASCGVCLHLSPTPHSLQLRFPFHLNPILAQIISQFVALVPLILQLGFFDLPQITYKVGCKRRHFVAPSRFNLHHDAGKIESMGFHCRYLITVHVTTKQYWTKWGGSGGTLNFLLQFRLFNLENATQFSQGVLHIAYIGRHQRQLECRPVIYQYASVTIIDNATSWRNIFQPNPIVL